MENMEKSQEREEKKSTKPRKTTKSSKKSPLKSPLFLVGGTLVLGVLALFGADAQALNQMGKALGLSADFSAFKQTKDTEAKQTPEDGDSTAEESSGQIKVERVVDGDTLRLSNGKTIRLLNVDTPETVKPNAAVMCFGPEASKFSKEFLTGKQVWLMSDKEKTDRYGRDLRFVFVTEEDFQQKRIENSYNATLIKMGMGREKTYRPNNTYQKDLQKIQFEAEQKKVGAWGKCEKPFEE